MRIPVSLAPRVLANALGNAASSLDRAAVRAAAWSTERAAPQVSRLSHTDRIAGLAQVSAAYGAPRFISAPDTFFPPAPPARPALAPARDLSSRLGEGAGVFDATWTSTHIALHPEVAARYGAHERNLTAHARLFLGPSGSIRPAVVAVHGYLGGQYRFEERAFPVAWMMRRGFDVALAVLPFHGLRSHGGSPPFPGSDPRYTIEGCRQSMEDIRALIGFLRARGAPAVGIMGMSLGGYVTSLLATLEPDLAFAVPIIPLASFADFARDQHRFGTGERAADQYRAYDAAMRVVSPLSRPGLVPQDRMLILAAEHDRITPKAHAERLAAHFNAPLVVFPGGHLLQFGRGDAFREVGRLWRRLGLGASRRVA